MSIKISRENIKKGLFTLHTFDSTPELPGNTRLLFSDEDMSARSYLKELMQEIGLIVREDSIGNIFGTLPGTDSSLPPVWSGSHFDTVINGGMYDGTVGTIGILEACRYIKKSGFSHKRDIVAVLFTSEESVRFGIGCIGSHALVGELSIEDTQNLKDDQGVSLYDAMRQRGYDTSKFSSISKKKGDIFAFLELHIEQGPILEQLEIPIGIVTGITAPSYLSVIIKGEQRHAGSTPMNARKDSLCAFAEIVLELESIARSYAHPNICATIGKVHVSPNASNVIAGETKFTIDLRSIDMEIKDKMINDILCFFSYLEKKRNITISYRIDSNDTPMFSSPKLVEQIEKTCSEKNLLYHKMNSGAYHDALLMAHIAPMAMIFVPSKDGISHDPAEFTEIEQITVGTEVLAHTLLKIANLDCL